MGLKFKSPLELSGHRAISHTDAAQTLVVKVVTKTTAHPEYGNGSTLGYTIDGVEGAYLEFTPGNTYKFDQSDSSNANHPLRFYEDAAKATAYTTGVTTNGTPGSSGAYTQIIPTTDTPPVLFYQCSNHALMGSYVKFGTGTIGDTYSIGVTQDGGNVDLKLDAASGTDSTVQLTAGSNVTLTRNDAQQVTIASTASGGISGITVQEEGSSLATAATTLNFTGTAVTASGTGTTKTIDVAGGAITVQEEGSSLSTAATTLNFTGSAVTASGSGAVKTINVTGGGSSGGTVTIEKNVYTGDGSDVTFDTSTAIVNENNVQVYIDGVYQSKNNYTTSGSTVTMSTAPGNSTSVELIHMVSVDAVIARDNFTGNNSTTAYVLSKSISNENATQVYLDGVYQSKDNYTTSGSTLTFSTAPPNGAAIEVVHIKASVDSSTQWQSAIKTSNFTAAAGEGYFVNTTSGAVTVSLPAGSVGDEIHFTDYASTFNTNRIIFDSNGSEKIQGRTTNAKNITEGATVRLIYQDATKGWTGNIADDPPIFSINYLVIAGGAAGGGFYRAGGGGAGGLRTSYGSTSGGGASAESIISNVSPGTSYTITVGAGGAGATYEGLAGSNSVFSTITSVGGGGGGRYTATTGTAGAAGGSGGGGGGDATGGAAGAGTANQGYAGGIGASSNIQCGGGGGGAGAVGKNGGAGATDGDGGDGIQSAILNYANAGTASVGQQISGSQVWYGGGGGGGSYASGNDTIPGKGGGGEGTNPSNYPTNGSPATVNTGGGGGGASGSSVVGGAGGSGVVILRYPSAQHITVPGGITQSSGSPFTEGSDKISVFTAGTGTISIS